MTKKAGILRDFRLFLDDGGTGHVQTLYSCAPAIVIGGYGACHGNRS